MKIIRMPVFASLILSAIPYLVSCSSETLPASAENKNSASRAASTEASDSARKSANNSANSSESKADGQNLGKSIELPHYQPDFPPGEHKDLFVSRCGVCHSLRYVTMQPDFPKKTWAKEVDKMIKMYGAHIDKKEAEAIIKYLSLIKGTKPGAEKH
jgi:mono/diheme cytochrome c family protein